MAIKELPTNIKDLYHLFHDGNLKKLEESKKVCDELILQSNKLRDEINKSKDTFKTNFDINLDDYSEFINGKHSEGKFLKVAKGLFINRKNNYELVSDLYDLYTYAINLQQIYNFNREIKYYEKLVKVGFKEYNNILKIFYTEVHRQLVIEGNGYSFGNNIGWTCINRCVIEKTRPHIDFVATKKREKELLAQGKRIYNKEEAEWCAKNGIEYVAEDKRIFKHDEYCYEIPLLGCKLPNCFDLRLTITDYRSKDNRGQTNEELIAKCNGDIHKICNLSIDLRAKLALCDKADKMLYIKYIRNENQKPVTYRKINSKDR